MEHVSQLVSDKACVIRCPLPFPWFFGCAALLFINEVSAVPHMGGHFSCDLDLVADGSRYFDAPNPVEHGMLQDYVLCKVPFESAFATPINEALLLFGQFCELRGEKFNTVNVFAD